ncbi:MAG: arginine--tRNA ligase [Methyloligellaceae bacterium]
MNIFSEFESRILKVVQQLKEEEVLSAEIEVNGLSVEPTKDPAHGDIASNIAMVLAKKAKMKPRDLAEKIASKLESDPLVRQIDIAGPGFINLWLKTEFWQEIVKAVLEGSREFGRSEVGKNQPVNVEYVSANPTGPMHVGHCRGAVFGDALANLLDFAGFDVTREYYINDAGAQINVLAQSAFLRYREALGEDIGEIPEGLYPGDYLVPVGEALAKVHGDKLLKMEEEEWLPIVKNFSIDANMDTIREDLSALGIKHDVFFSERSLIQGDKDEVAETINWLREQGIVYEGRLPPPKGKLPDDWEDREQTLFKATDFGDDVDRALIKSDDSYTYFASDMAYHNNKYKRGFQSMINVWGADHGGYIKRMDAAVKALTAGKGDLDVKICQMVNLLRAGKPIKMSKRAGTFVTLRDVVDEVGSDSVRFMMLYRKNDAMLDFDFDKVVEQSRDNPVFYVQYAHARIFSVFRNTHKIFPEIGEEGQNTDWSNAHLIDSKEEISLIQKLAQFPRLIESASVSHEPHRVAFYLYGLASDFHAIWNLGKEVPQLRFIKEDERELTIARMALLKAVATVLDSGLKILGVKPVKEMH